MTESIPISRVEGWIHDLTTILKARLLHQPGDATRTRSDTAQTQHLASSSEVCPDPKPFREEILDGAKGEPQRRAV